jgi:hypothetical protein
MRFPAIVLFSWFVLICHFNLVPVRAVEALPSSIPHLALGGGYECVIVVTNRTRASWKGKASISQQNGSAWSGTWEVTGAQKAGSSSFSIELGPMATRKYVLKGDKDVRTGYLQIHSGLESQRGPNDSLAVSFFYSFNNGPSLADSTGVTVSKLGTAFMFPVERRAAINTGFAWAPASVNNENLEELHLELYNRIGQRIQNVSVPFEGHRAQFFSEVFKNLPEDFLGKVIVRANKSFLLTVIRLESTENGFQLTNVPPSAYPVREEPDDRIVYSQLALGGGYRCILLLSNGSDEEWEGIGRLNQGNSKPWNTPWSVNGTPSSGSSFDINLPPHSSAKFVLDGDPSVLTGFFNVESKKGFRSDSIVPSFFYLYRIGARMIDSTGGPYSKVGNLFSFPVERNQEVNTGVAWAPDNSLGQGAQIQARLYNAQGELIRNKSVAFNGHQSQFVDEIFGTLPQTFLGSMQLESDSPFVLTIIRLQQAGSGFQLTSVPPVSEGLGSFQLIGPTGGVSQDEKGASVSVPAGVLKEDLLISVRTIEDLNSSTTLEGPLARVAGAVELGPSGLEFDDPVTVTIPLQEPGVPGTQMPIFQYFPENGVWSQTKFTGTVDAGGTAVVADVDHFSTLAILTSSLEYMDLFSDFLRNWHKGSLEARYGEVIERVMSMFPIGKKEPFQFGARALKCYEIVGVTFVLDHNEPDKETPFQDIFGIPPFKAPPCEGLRCFTDTYGPILITFHNEDEFSTSVGAEERIRSIQLDVNIWLDCAPPILTLTPQTSKFESGKKAQVLTCLECGGYNFEGQEILFMLSDNVTVTPERLVTNDRCQMVDVVPEYSETCEDLDMSVIAEYGACFNDTQSKVLRERVTANIPFSVEGLWSWVETADETACDEGVNTYVRNARISVSGETITVASGSGFVYGSKNGCSVKVTGSEFEDSGFSWGSGSFTFNKAGTFLSGSGSWTWSGDGESCSGTSKIKATKIGN